MRVRLVAPPWGKPELTDEAKEAVGILGEDIWAAASVDFYAKREALVRAGKHAPKGMQQTLNSIIDERFSIKGWEGDSGFNSHPRFPFCKRVSHFESDLQILYPTFHFCNDFPVFSLAFMI